MLWITHTAAQGTFQRGRLTIEKCYTKQFQNRLQVSNHTELKTT